MYEQTTQNKGNIKIFGIKIFEQERLDTEVFEREFLSDEDSQPLLYSYASVTCKFFGIPVVKSYSKFANETTKTEEPKFKINITKNKILSLVVLTLTMTICFVCGIFTANSTWFNDVFYIKSRQMINLTPKSIRPYDRALFKKAETQDDMNIASGNRYKHYHEYYEKVVERIRYINYYDDKVRDLIIGYIDGYEERKELFSELMFPYINEPTEDGGAYYRLSFGSVYPIAMLEFDRQELLTYRMILSNMYYDMPYPTTVNAIFEEE